MKQTVTKEEFKKMMRESLTRNGDVMRQMNENQINAYVHYLEIALREKVAVKK